MAQVGTNAANLASLDEILRHSSKLCKIRLAVFDVVDDTLQSICVLFQDGIDDVPKVFGECITAFVGR
jgi:hypothetical protein